MFFIILVSHDNIPTLFGPYCSFKSALDIVQGPCFRVPVETLSDPRARHQLYRNHHRTHPRGQTGMQARTSKKTTN